MTYFLNNNFRNNEFELMTNDKYFVDKTELIAKMNELIYTKDRFVCITRPRRFGKTVNAMMLASYYSKNADFKSLFDKLEISKDESYLEHLHKHNVIYLTLNSESSELKTYLDYIKFYKTRLIRDIVELCPDVNTDNSISEMLTQAANTLGQGFIFIIDEWDYIFNNNLFSAEERLEFLKFLKDLLKDKPYVELAYMTGVLPIAKYSTGSALNMFVEYNALNDQKYYKFFGFSLEETKALCNKQNEVTFDELKEWYNGYKTCKGNDIFNPRSVVCALRDGVCQSYWTNTGPMDEIIYHINHNVGAVRDDVISMVAGIPVEIKIKGYGAEKLSLNTRDEILSAMTVYGFLSYHDETLEIPNKELMMKFEEALEDKSMDEVSNLVLKSNEMLKATLRRDTETMAALLEETHDINTPMIKYNDENSLACVVMLAYLSARTKYKIIREMPAGKGFADFIFFPKDKTKPAFILELKVNSSPEEALQQIKEKKYALALKDYTGEKLAVGISWDKQTKEHEIMIEDL